MRVLLIDVNCKGSSTGQIVYNLYKYLNAHGDTAAVCYGRGEAIQEKNIFKFGLDWETKLHALLTRLTGFTGCFSFFSTKRLIRFIEAFQPDVVHIHELHAYFVNIVPLLNYLAEQNIKVIHTLHCEFSYTGKCGHSFECEKWKQSCGDCPRVHAYPTSLFFDHTRTMLRQKKEAFGKIKDLVITTPSEWLSERARTSFFSNREIITIHNGVDTSVFYPRDAKEIRREYGIQDEEKIALALAPHLMSEGKGGKFVVQLAKRLTDKVRFILVGVDGVTERNEENMILLGPIYDKDQLAKLYSTSDVLIMCSQKETFSLSCAEAICCGTPIVGFKCGAPETIFDASVATFVPYGDVNQLEKETRRRLQYSKNSRRISAYAADSFAEGKMIDDYSQLYRRGKTA